MPDGAGMVKRTGGQLLADALVAQGASHVFAVPGESYLDLLDGLYARRNEIQLITCRFEAGAVHMAEAVGKMTGKPGVAAVTRGPGACHASIGVHVAMQDSTPLVLLVGQIPIEETDRETFQEVDYRRMFSPLAKWVTQIDDAKRIPEIMAHAFDVAVSGRPGPVVVAISEEMQKDAVSVPDLGIARVLPPHPAPESIPAMLEMLKKAQRPLAILGGGAMWSEEGRADIAAFLQANDIPTAVSFRRQGLFDGTSPLFAGDLGVGADAGLVQKAKEADLLLAFGTRMGEPVSQGYTLLDMAGRTPIVQVYPDQAEIGRVYRVALGITADVNRFARAIRDERVAGNWSEWRQSVRAAREAQAQAPEYEGPLNLARALQALEQVLPDDTIFTTDAGNFATWPTRFMHLKPKQEFLGPTNGAMGYGVPAAIGAAVAYPNRQVIGFVGDGGFMMTGQEIATAFHHKVAPIIMVFNNGMYGTIRMYQERVYPGRVSGTELTNPDFARFIEAFGGHGEVVEATDELVPAYKRAAASGKPAIIEVRMNPEQVTNRATIADLRAQAKK
ncbi:thiamine pyrophosphate-dependent enzyme [Sabulicella glaciei]|uniref:Thiamine pyrophosphate-binding protein n=1 Tax=Sabulicella glaciei TaxID=2984948 RepID=A0ABT3NXA5_9PROT|nr:thiamine pyrophosphate-dependent enzyme [Roseococcus sp. MDT2-1-1]MCW8086199.1 thiamine pyrophosphate-binding protein [Roseococcus sp. MDT2-1-1]